MTAEELHRMLERQAEAMTEEERWQFIERLRSLASTPRLPATWLDRLFGPVVKAGDVQIWPN